MLKVTIGDIIADKTGGQEAIEWLIWACEKWTVPSCFSNTNIYWFVWANF